jgi:8-hydroxy-5-deazaflavin:NADPH oxidoreductase
MKVAIIGSGNVGKALAGSAVKAGHQVVLAASDPAHAKEAAQAVGASAAGSGAEAIAGAEIVVLAVPSKVLPELVGGLSAELEGKPVVDASNRINREDPISVLDGSSVTEQAQAKAPGAHFVKAFNTIFASVMADPTQEGRLVDVFLAGDDAGAKAKVAELAASMGFRPIDCGPAAMARVIEGMGMLNVSLQIAHGWPWQSSFKLVGPTGDTN